MKRIVTSSKKNDSMIHIKDSDWYRLITRLESQTGLKVDNDSKWDKDRDYLRLEDPKTDRKYEVEVEKVTYYEVDGNNFSYL